ncbi:sensor histidine kinase [Polaromonas sp. YR568]|uniref:sensor histidine kinase n=1 Tax=Polaromonas sp. YR568 TaxID=1855301 RepID=UPI00398BD74A
MKTILPSVVRTALGIGVLYAVLGVVWIFGSDALVASISTDPQWTASAQRYKGIFYVLSTSLALIFLINAGYKRLFQAQARAESTELRMRDMFLQHPQPMWVYDKETLGFLAVNDAAIRYYGYSRDEFMRLTLKDIRPAEDVPGFLAARQNAMGGHRDIGVVRHRKKTGEVVFVHLALHGVQFAGRQAAMVMALDVTAEVLSKRALERQEAQFRQLHQSLADGLWIANADGRTLLYVSPAVEHIYGHSPEALIANPDLWLEVVHPDDAGIAAASRHTLLAKGEASCEYRIRTPSGEVKWVSDRKRLIFDDERLVTMMGGILKDITANKERETLREASHLDLERQVAQRTSELQRVNAELDAFARTIAHDLRAPLTTVAGYTQLLKKRYASALGDEGARMMTRIDRSAKQMANLIDDLLALSRASTAQLNIRNVDLVPLAREILEELQDQAPERKVRFDAPESLRVQADLSLVRPLLANLLSNAWKFTGRREDASIRLFQDIAAPEAAICVQDNGVGFDTDGAGLIFQPFQRFHSASEFSGTGIGLTTCERIVSRHGGRIWLESTPGEGTSVFFTLAPKTGTENPQP